MQTEGTLTETSLATLLAEMQSERATGTLTVANQGENTSLYFLFGHLFHASGQTLAGEDAVLDALTWGDGSFSFDPRAKLPAEETIKLTSDELIAEAQTRTPVGVATAVAPAPQPAGYQPDSVIWPAATNGTGDYDSTAGPVEVAPSYDSRGSYGEGGDPVADYQSQQEQPSDQPTLPDELEATQAYVEAEPVAAPHTPASPLPQPKAEPVTAPKTPVAKAPVEPEVKVVAKASPEPASEPILPSSTAAGTPSTRGGAAASTDLPPLPAGKEIYHGLKTSFVDFQKLLNTLQKDRHTGYLQLDGEDYTGYLLLNDGQPIEAVFAKSDALTQGQDGLDKFREAMGAGEGMLDVLELPSGVISALVQMLTSKPLFTGLVARFIDFDEMLGYLRDEKVTGAVVVSASSDSGVILLKSGDILGAYTKKRAAIESLTAQVSNLASQNPKATIEVRSGAPVDESANPQSAAAKRR